jgi:hypothetical protein
MLPRPRGAHDQLLRAIWVAGIGGLIIGHILWLLGISLAIATTSVEPWVLLLSAVIGVMSAAAALIGWLSYRRKSHIWAAFLWCLPIAPVLLTLSVLGVMYL